MGSDAKQECGDMPTPSGGKLSRTVIFQSFCF